MTFTPEVEAYWLRFLASLPAGSPRPAEYQAWYFGNSQAMARELSALVLAGTKTATASLVWSYQYGNEPEPQEGGFSVITDFDGRPLCVIESTRIYIRPFNEVDEEQAYLEGEDDRSLASWREVHWRYFSAECRAMGREPAEDMLVVCERFRVVFAEA